VTAAPSRRRRLLRERAAGLVVIGAIFLASWLLPLLGGTSLRICPFHLLTGLPCPGCGLGRAFCALTWGDPLAALRYHLLGPLIYLGFVLALLRSLGEIVAGRPLLLPPGLRRWANPLALVLLVGVVVVWGIRLAGVWPLPD